MTTSLLALAVLPATPWAQALEGATSQAQAKSLDAIKVTAARRTTLVEKTPIALTAVTAETLLEIGAVDVKDYASQVPGLSVQSSSPSAQRLSLRGVNSAGEATVGLYYDETPVSGSVGTTSDAGSRNADIDLFDVDRIEVLRGPQGTLYGASSMGGAIRIIYQKSQQEYAGAVRLGYFFTDGGEPSHSAEGMVNVPLIDNTLAVRMTGYNRETGGYADNTFIGIKSVNSLHAKGGKLQLRYTPLDTLSVDLRSRLRSIGYLVFFMDEQNPVPQRHQPRSI